MAALLEDREGVVVPVVVRVGVPVVELVCGVFAAIEKLPMVLGGGEQPGLSPALQRVLAQGFSRGGRTS